jgi:hypothetical protein
LAFVGSLVVFGIMTPRAARSTASLPIGWQNRFMIITYALWLVVVVTQALSVKSRAAPRPIGTFGAKQLEGAGPASWGVGFARYSQAPAGRPISRPWGGQKERTNAMAKFERVIPLLVYRDIRRSRFLANVFGFGAGRRSRRKRSPFTGKFALDRRLSGFIASRRSMTWVRCGRHTEFRSRGAC